MLLAVILSTITSLSPSPSAAPLPFSSEPYNPFVVGAPQGDTASPNEFRYSYAYGGLSSGEATGLRTGAVYELEGPWVALGQFSYVARDLGLVDIDFMMISAGAGYVSPIEQGLDFIGSLELEYGRSEANVYTPFGSAGGDTSEVGIKARTGVRYMMDSNLELYGGLGFRTIFGGDFGLDGGALYRINDRFSAFVELEYADLSLYTVGVRYHM